MFLTVAQTPPLPLPNLQSAIAYPKAKRLVIQKIEGNSMELDMPAEIQELSAAEAEAAVASAAAAAQQVGQQGAAMAAAAAAQPAMLTLQDFLQAFDSMTLDAEAVV